MLALGGALLSAPAPAQQGPEVHGRWHLERGLQGDDALPQGSQPSARTWTWGLSTPTPPITIVAERWRLLNLVDFEHTHVSFLAGPLSLEDGSFSTLGLGIWRFSDKVSGGLGGGTIHFFGEPTWTPMLSLDASYTALHSVEQYLDRDTPLRDLSLEPGWSFGLELGLGPPTEAEEVEG